MSHQTGVRRGEGKLGPEEEEKGEERKKDEEREKGEERRGRGEG